MKYTIPFMAIILIALLCLGCQVTQNNSHVFNLYQNEFFDLISPSLESGITNYIVKAHNCYNIPILIPFTTYHQIPSSSSFKSIISNDSITDITFYGASFTAGLGWDTLYAGETQRYFISIPNLDKKVNKKISEIVSLKYYSLKDMESGKDDEDIINHEFFILIKTSSEEVYIFKPEKSFNPYYDRKYPIPKVILKNIDK